MDDDARISNLWSLIEQKLPVIRALEYLENSITDFENGTNDFLAQWRITKLVLVCHARKERKEEEISLCKLTKRYVRCAVKIPETSWNLFDSIIECWEDPLYVEDCPCGEWLFQYMAECGANLNARDLTGTTVLHRIVQSKKDTAARISVMRILLENGVDPNFKDFFHATPVDLANTLEEKSLLRRSYSLQCLAIEEIINENICFKLKIPGRLRRLIDAHRKVQLPYGLQQDQLLSS